MSKLYRKSFSAMGERTRQYEWAVNGLSTINEVHSCRNLWNGNHWFNGGIMLILLVGLIITQYTGLILFLNVLSFSYFFYRFIVTLIGMGGDPDAGEMVEYSDDLPTYCILLPMRNEPLTVVSHLIENINNLNYPKDKLDVIMLVDQDDDYLGDILEMPKPKHFRVVSSAATFPFTKPKVCNLGLADTDAEYVTVYDVEDNPEPNQLLKVLYKFNENNADCVQCRLHYNNEKPNLQAKFFNLEYLTWFTMTITGLHKVQGDRAVIPLGGTSQHLRTETLKELGGWDAYNVTEDCDLGIRLARTGKSTVISDSVTDEIAIEGLSDFVKQRTRWQMGFMVTYITHCRDIFNLYRELGIWRFFHFIMFVLGNVLNPLITPILFFIFIESLLFNGTGETYLEMLPWITLIGNYVFLVLSHLIATIRYQKGGYWYLAILQPIYYLIQVYSVNRALIKLIRAPYTWEKTPHV